MDELTRLEKTTEVFVGPEGLEAPAKTFVPGPYYVAIDEVIPELGNIPEEVAGDKKSFKSWIPDVDRRDFMRLFSASAMFGAASCVRRPEEKAIPYVNQPIDHVPGVAVHYATTCNECAAGCGVIVKTREGRPVKLEGSARHPLSQGGMCALGQASIQGLYHPERQKTPLIRYGKRQDPADWSSVYQKIAEKVGDSTKIGILTGGSTGFQQQFFKAVLKKLGASENNLYTWESNSLYTAIGKAHELAFGQEGLPRIEFRKTNLVVSLGSDFLELGTSPTFHAKTFTKALSYINGKMGQLVQFEATYSLTGTKASKRVVIPPGYEFTVALLLLRSLLAAEGVRGEARDKEQAKQILAQVEGELAVAEKALSFSRHDFDALAKDMLAQNAVILAGSSASFDENSTKLQLVTILLNLLTGAYGSSLLFDRGWMTQPVKIGDMERFLTEAENLDVLFVIDTNPIFSCPPSWGVKEKLEKVKTVVSVQAFPNEVDDLAKFSLPGYHYLEAWGDEQPFAGFWSLRQPAVRATTDCRQAEDVLLWVLAHLNKPFGFPDYRAYLEEQYKSVFKQTGMQADYKKFYKAILRQGFVIKLDKRTQAPLAVIATHVSYKAPTPGLKLLSPLDHRLQDGRGAHLPVLQDIGDGMTTIAWDSWLAIHPDTATKLHIKRNQLVELTTEAGTIKVAAFPLPGIHPDALIVPRGNGHKGGSKISGGVGVDPLVVYPKAKDELSASPKTSDISVKITPTNEWYRLAAMQKHNDIANRTDIVKKITLSEAASNLKKQQNLDVVPDLYPKLEDSIYRWGLSIDLNRCNGCGACMVACAIENNVVQAGREQIIMGREMHWIRLDRYFFGDVNNPDVTFQPVMCQHCNHAPCEPVCPVFATSHDPEGLNAMTYNRCVGTRYCANACPYKVRRFNWWHHKWGEIGERLQDRNLRALNPDVTVRTKGVMEKCSFCVGRLRDAKHTAKEQKRYVFDGEVQTACQQTCPSDAISFGNLNKATSKVSAERASHRAYLLLGGEPEHGHYGLKTLPNVSYLAEVKHTLKEAGSHSGQHEEKNAHHPG